MWNTKWTLFSCADLDPRSPRWFYLGVKNTPDVKFFSKEKMRTKLLVAFAKGLLHPETNITEELFRETPVILKGTETLDLEIQNTA